MPFVIEKFSSVYCSGKKSVRFEVTYCPTRPEKPWGVSYRGQGHYFRNLEAALAYAAGRGLIEEHQIMNHANDIVAAIDQALEK